MQVLLVAREERKKEWEAGNFLGAPKDVQMTLNAAAIGECTAYKRIQELTMDQLNQEIEDAIAE